MTYYVKYKSKDNLIFGKGRPMKQYALSKLCISNLYAYHRDNNKNVNVKYLLCEPGAAATGLFKTFPKWFKKLAIGFLNIFTNSPKKGSLSGCKLMCDICANGDYYRPGGLFTISGFPKKAKFKSKTVYPNIISDAQEMLKQYE